MDFRNYADSVENNRSKLVSENRSWSAPPKLARTWTSPEQKMRTACSIHGDNGRKDVRFSGARVFVCPRSWPYGLRNFQTPAWVSPAADTRSFIVSTHQTITWDRVDERLSMTRCWHCRNAQLSSSCNAGDTAGELALFGAMKEICRLVKIRQIFRHLVITKCR